MFLDKRRIRLGRSTLAIILLLSVSTIATSSSDKPVTVGGSVNISMSDSFIELVAEKAENKKLQGIIKRQRQAINRAKETTRVIKDGPMSLLVLSESKRIGCEIKYPFVDAYLMTLRELESSGSILAENPDPRATSHGSYGFTIPSLERTAQNGKRYANHYWGFVPPRISEIASGDYVYQNHEQEWLKVLVFVHSWHLGAPKKLSQEAFCHGDKKAAVKMYLTFHHTVPEGGFSEEFLPRVSRYMVKNWPKDDEVKKFLQNFPKKS